MVEIKTSTDEPQKVELVGEKIIGYQARVLNFNVKETKTTDPDTKEEITQYEYESIFVNAMAFEYEKIVPMLVRAHYSADDEFAIQRKAILGDTEEFNAYNDWVQYCKTFAMSLFED